MRPTKIDCERAFVVLVRFRWYLRLTCPAWHAIQFCCTSHVSTSEFELRKEQLPTQLKLMLLAAFLTLHLLLLLGFHLLHFPPLQQKIPESNRFPHRLQFNVLSRSRHCDSPNFNQSVITTLMRAKMANIQITLLTAFFDATS